MTDSSRTTRSTPSESEAPSKGMVPLTSVVPSSYAAPAHFLEVLRTEDLEMLCQLAAQLLEDPLAMQQVSDRVVELLRQDLVLQQERSRGYGRRH